MTKSIPFKIICLCLLSVLLTQLTYACSMYKVTANGKTMVGNNEDSWGKDAQIWFEPKGKNKYGVVYVGYQRKYPNPDGAMNEAGLAFDAFSMPHKPNLPERDPNKKDFSYSMLITIMQQCQSVDEVYAFLNGMNLQVLNGSILFHGGMLLFVDKSGKYLVVEPNQMTFGSDRTFALANFSIADTKDVSSVKVERYCKGIAFLNNKKTTTNLSFCTALSDTMSVNRAKIGDGTLYTNICDLNEGLIHLYFFHEFGKRITLNLNEEMAKGPHAYNFAELFPNNPNYERFIAYQTPQNNRSIFISLIACGLLFFFSFCYFIVGIIRNKNTSYRSLRMGLSMFSLALSYYTFVLLRNEGIYYFPSPYIDSHSWLITLSSYLPYVLLIAIVPLLYTLLQLFKNKKWNKFARYVFGANSFAYLLLLCFFVYWKLY